MLTIKFYHEDRELLTLIMVSGVIFDPTVLKHVIFFNRSELLGNHQGQINDLSTYLPYILSKVSLVYHFFCSGLSGINGLALFYTWISPGLSTPGDSLFNTVTRLYVVYTLTV